MNPFSHFATLPRHPAIRFKDKSERSVLLFALYTFCGVLLVARLWYLCSQWRFLRQCRLPHCCVTTNKGHLVDTRILHWPPVLFTRVPCSSFGGPESNTLSTLHKCNLHILVRLLRSHLKCKKVEKLSIHFSGDLKRPSTRASRSTDGLHQGSDGIRLERSFDKIHRQVGDQSNVA